VKPLLVCAGLALFGSGLVAVFSDVTTQVLLSLVGVLLVGLLGARWLLNWADGLIPPL
jgi:hypothetical protein